MIRIFLLAFSLLLISACAGTTPSPTIPTMIVPEMERLDAQGQAAIPPTVPAPRDGRGVIVGRLVHGVSGIGIPSQLIYLGEYLPLTPGPGEMVVMQVESSVKTITDENGYFTFEGVDPGEYPLIVWTPFTSKVVPDAYGEAAFSVKVDAGGVTRLGDVGVIWP